MNTKYVTSDDLLDLYLNTNYKGKYVVVAFANDCDDDESSIPGLLRESYHHFISSFTSKRYEEDIDDDEIMSVIKSQFTLFVFADEKEAMEFHNDKCDEAKVCFYAQIWGPITEREYHKWLQVPSLIKGKTIGDMVVYSENT